MNVLFFILFSCVLVGCHHDLNTGSTVNINNCPDFYAQIEGISWAEEGFSDPSDIKHQYWYRLITFSEEEGFNIFVEKLRQGIVEGTGKMEVIERTNITHLKNIDDVDGISLHYNIKGWVNAKEVILEVTSQDTSRSNTVCKILNVEKLTVNTTPCNP